MTSAWRAWLRFAQILGNVQMTIVLTVVYWLFVTVLFIPAGIISDPLRVRRVRGWLERTDSDAGLDSMRRQG